MQLLLAGKHARAAPTEKILGDVAEPCKLACDTARNVTDLGQEELVKRTDLEEETVAEVLRILKAELEK